MDNNERSIMIQKTYNQLWGWLRDNFDRVMSYDPYPQRLHYTSGRLGHNSSRGKPAFGGEYHNDFLRYMNTPRSIKKYHSVLQELSSSNRPLYTYLFLRASGMTLAEIEETGLIEYPLTRRQDGQSGVKATFAARRFNLEACKLLVKHMPKELVEKLGIKQIVAERPMSNRQKRNQAVDCPACRGEDPDCTLCYGDGEVPDWLAKKYIHRTGSGEEWEDRG